MHEKGLRVTISAYSDRKYLMMRYLDPVTGKLKSRSTGTNNRREAERIAAKWEAELQEGRYRQPSKIDWDNFRDRYEDEKLSSLSVNTLGATTSAFNHLERIINPKKLESLTSIELSRFQAELRRTGIAETSIATHLRHIRAALSWAHAIGLLSKVPQIQMPKRAKGKTFMRGRPVTAEEFERMLAKVPEVRPRDANNWSRYLSGLWLSGLRLEESLTLSWDDDAPIAIDLSGRRPQLRIYAEAEKGHQDRFLPISPDFAELLLETPVSARHGRAFPLDGLQTKTPITPKRVSRIVGQIGELANVLVNKTAGKFASAHDLRRAFGTRWAARVKPATLQLLMRHENIETTMKYYVAQNADDVADELWAFARSPKGAAAISTDAAQLK
jgi:integrase